MSARSRDLLSAALVGAGIMGAGELYFACNASTNADGAYWKDWFDTDKYFAGANCISSGYNAMETGRQDVLFLGAAAGISTTAGITWAKNQLHVVGLGCAMPGQRSYRARVNPSSGVATAWTISGYGNSFHNFAMNHGGGSTAGTCLLHITGARNWFNNMHMACYNSSDATVATYSMVKLGDCSEVGFRNVYFGSDSITMASGQMLEYTSDTTIRAYYENCNWVMNSTNAAALFVHVKPGAGKGTSIFKNCAFINNSGQALTVGVASSGLVNTGHQFFMFGTRFHGVSDIANAAEEATVLFDSAHAATTGGVKGNSTVGLMVHCDHSS